MFTSDAGISRLACAILIIGGPGSGKTTLSRSFLANGVVRIDPDAIRESLPVYRTLLQRGGVDLVEATRAETNRLADQMLERAVQARQNLVFDASGLDRDWYVGMIRSLSGSGFEVTVAMVFADPELARRRSAERARLNGRTVNDEYFSRTHSYVPVHFLHYLKVAARFILVQNDDETPLWVWHRTAEGDVARQPALLRAYFDRFAPGGHELIGSFPPDAGLGVHDAWFEQVRQRMESLPGWDLSLETTFSEER